MLRGWLGSVAHVIGHEPIRFKNPNFDLQIFVIRICLLRAWSLDLIALSRSTRWGVPIRNHASPIPGTRNLQGSPD